MNKHEMFYKETTLRQEISHKNFELKKCQWLLFRRVTGHSKHSWI